MESKTALQLPDINSQGRNNLFSIRPYENNLLTPGARYWIICIHLVILVMATSEAIAWGYLGSLFGKESLGVIAAIVTFVFMFLIVWVIDVSFVTLDLARSYYDKIILKKETERWIDNTRLGVGLLGRVIIVFVSLSISAPFLAQIVFKQDIDNEIDRINMARVSMVSDSMLISKDEEIAAVDSMILVREADLIEETAGKGSSGNYGDGPVTRAMERNIARLREERAGLVRDKIVLDQTMQSLTVDEFAELYNVDLVDNGVRTREEILGGLMENPEYRTAKTAITAFLAFIFAALVLLKLFQPRSVRIYYNEKLQDLYREYLAGHLNKWIAPFEQSIDGRSQMSPLRFEDWCVNTYSEVRNEDIKRRDSRKIYNLFKMKIEQLEEEKAEIKKMMEPIEEDFERAMEEVNDIKVELLEVENELQQNEKDGEEISRQLENISDDLRHNRFQGSDVLFAVTAKKEAEERLVANKNDRLSLQYKHDLIRHRFDVKDADARQVEALMAKIRQRYRDLQDKIDRERTAYTDLVVSGHVVEIPHRDYQRRIDNLLEASAGDSSTEDPVDLIVAPSEEGRPSREDDETQGDLFYDENYDDDLADVEAPSDEEEAPEEAEEPVDRFSDVAAHESQAEETEIPWEFEEEPEGVEERGDQLDEAAYMESPEEEAEIPWDFEEEVPEDEPEDRQVFWYAASDQPASARNGSVARLDDVADAENDLSDEDEYPVWQTNESFVAESPHEESPVRYVDDEQLNAYAEAASLAKYEEETSRAEAVGEDQEDEPLEEDIAGEEAEEDAEEPETDRDATPDYFVDPALLSDYSYKPFKSNSEMEEVEDVEDLHMADAESEEVNASYGELQEVEDLEDQRMTDAESEEIMASSDELQEAEDAEDLHMADAESEKIMVSSDQLQKDEAGFPFEEDFKSFLAEDADEDLESTLVNEEKLVGHGNRTDRKGRMVRKGNFGKAFGESA